MKGLRVKAQAIPVATSIRLGAAGQVGGLGDRGAEQLRRPDALDAGRLGALRLGLEVGDRGADRGDRDAVERAQLSAAQRALGRTGRRPRRGRRRRPARGATWRRRTSPRSALPRLRKKWRSCSQVKPMPPCTWIEASGDPPAGVGGVGLGHRGGQRQRLGLGVGGPGGAVDGRARVLGLQQHLRAAVGDRLVGADRPAELLAVFGVLDRHLHRPLGDPGRLGGERDADAVEDRQVVGLPRRAGCLPARPRRRRSGPRRGGG